MATTLPILTPNELNTLLAKIANSGFYSAVTATPTAPASTGTYTMVGLAGKITPSLTGRILLLMGGIGGNTNGNGFGAQISYGTGAAPAAAGALAGTQVGPIFTMAALTGNLTEWFDLSAAIAGLTLGTTYWLDLAAAQLTGGTATLTQASITAVEI
jgi:hypothetical protein